MRAWVAAPWKDLMSGLDSVLEGKAPRLAQVMIGLLAGWWVYVPVHELSHAGACWMAGGTVSRLEIDPMYGGGALASIVPWVTKGVFVPDIITILASLYFILGDIDR